MTEPKAIKLIRKCIIVLTNRISEYYESNLGMTNKERTNSDELLKLISELTTYVHENYINLEDVETENIKIITHYIIADENNSEDFFNNPYKEHPFYLAFMIHSKLNPNLDKHFIQQMNDAIFLKDREVRMSRKINPNEPIPF